MDFAGMLLTTAADDAATISGLAELPEAKGAPTPLKADPIVKAGTNESPAKAPGGDSASYAKGDNPSGGTGGQGNTSGEKPKESDVPTAKGTGQGQ